MTVIVANTGVADGVRRILVDILGADASQITDEQVLEDDLGVDSLDVIELAMAVEEAFEIEVTEEEASGLRTVGDLIDFVRRAIGKQESTHA